jgi:hypothetical protein
VPPVAPRIHVVKGGDPVITFLVPVGRLIKAMDIKADINKPASAAIHAPAAA